MDDPIRDCLGFRLGAAFRRVDRFFNRAYARLGITHAHAQVLLCVVRAGELRPREIAAATGFDPSTVSRLVKELCRRKLLRRRGDESDRRGTLLSPAARTAAFAERLLHQQDRVNARLQRELRREDLEALFRTADSLGRLP
jgi:DNA-binding MarR family transcriptional regulator